MRHYTRIQPSPEQNLSKSSGWPRVTWIAGLLVLTAGYRLLAGSPDSGLENTSPLMAVCFGGGLLLGWRFCWVPVFLLLASDWLLGLLHGTGLGGYTATSALVYSLAAMAGAWAGGATKERRWLTLFSGTLVSSLLFYAVANSYVWFISPLYEKSFAGWLQSQTTGLPQFQPQAWVFLVRSLIGDTLWCLLAAPLFFWAPVKARNPEWAAARA